MHDHDHRWDRNWRRMEAMARRGFRKFGNFEANINPGDWGGFGGNFRIGRMLASGDLRLVALYLIEQQPRHGYDLIKAIEEHSHGFYSPSPGIVYPALTYLEEAGYVTSAADGNKKLYTITDEGRTHLEDNREAIQSTLEFLAKAGSGMEHLRERMQSRDFPFTPEEAEHFREHFRGMGKEFGRRGWFGDRETSPPPHPDRPERPERPEQPFRAERPDRDIDDVAPEVNEARKALKKAIKQALRQGPEQESRISEILRRAAQDIRAGLDDDPNDIDLG
ncbi:PadR family transcriptional regulator [Devosia sp. ZB163]|uniref:PadR family transcriptional regulator n=1 Tax=Devosia sp. ZB163 TaxID=3025938 RepID=UPI00235FF895|nr:PadR family transcriptional regulator [Devosia sp. ZB163]MDC9822330.1 PadR family transcriptional regulator [Devosia sp. ZB163]